MLLKNTEILSNIKIGDMVGYYKTTKETDTRIVYGVVNMIHRCVFRKDGICESCVGMIRMESHDYFHCFRYKGDHTLIATVKPNIFLKEEDFKV